MQSSSLEHCLLALIEHRQCSGYDLRKILTETPMRHYSDSPGSIYPALQRIARRGWIKPISDRSSRRRRTIYHLTTKGGAELKRWLSQPVDEQQIADHLDEVMLRLSFHHLLGDSGGLSAFLAAIGSAAHSYAARLRDFIRTSTAGYPLGASLALNAGLGNYQWLARWAASQSKKLERKRTGPQAAALRRRKR